MGLWATECDVVPTVTTGAGALVQNVGYRNNHGCLHEEDGSV